MDRVSHLNVTSAGGRDAVACGAKSFYLFTRMTGRVTCEACRRTHIYRAAASRDVEVSQPLRGIVLAPLSCLTCGEPADEVNMSVNVSGMTHDTGEYVPGDLNEVALSDRIGTACDVCGITLDETWPLTALVFVGKQNGVTP